MTRQPDLTGQVRYLKSRVVCGGSRIITTVQEINFEVKPGERMEREKRLLATSVLHGI